MSADIVINTEKSFDKKDEEQYFYIPFDVPRGIQQISIALTHDKGNTIDLGLVFPDGTQNGASGGRTKNIVIRESFATPGYTACVPVPGRWQVILGIYRVSGTGTAKLKITLTPESESWLKGDTHVHTYNSDGRLSPTRIIEKCEKKGFDFVFITDHNNCAAHRGNLMSERVSVLKGMELTLYAGHINLFGVDSPLTTPYCACTDEQLAVLLRQAREKGALVSLNHPECRLCGFHLDREAVAPDCAEVWNGPMRTDNMDALSWWHRQLLSGKRITAVGGSDYHRDYLFTDLLGLPVTAVLAKSRNSADILAAVKQGRCIVTSGVDGALTELTYGDARIGDSTAFTTGTSVCVHVSNAVRGHILRVYNNDTVILSRRIDSSGKLDCECEVPERGFVRAELPS